MLIHHHFHLAALNRDRRVTVWLPPSYSTGKRYYSVVYMHDGQNLFRNEEAFGGRAWMVGDTIAKLPIRHQAIVVGIDNGGQHRINEYAPFRQRGKGGEADLYLDFIVHTIKPFVDQHYRTLAYAEHTAMIGSSLGGLLTLYAGLRYPQVFGRIGVMSPAFWFNPGILNLPVQGDLAQSRIYAVGSRTESRGMANTLQQTYWRMKQLGVSDEQLTVIVRERGRHSETFWGREYRRMHLALLRQGRGPQVRILCSLT
jgi:predicted alpha/beta superfamily hydrolase